MAIKEVTSLFLRGLELQWERILPVETVLPGMEFRWFENNGLRLCRIPQAMIWVASDSQIDVYGATGLGMRLHSCLMTDEINRRFDRDHGQEGELVHGIFRIIPHAVRLYWVESFQE